MSTSTYAMVLHGGLPLTAGYVNALTRVLGIPVNGLTALLASPRWTAEVTRAGRTNGRSAGDHRRIDA